MIEWIYSEQPSIRRDGATTGINVCRTRELVRCKDCIHRDENHRCYADNPMRGQFVGNEWFCADGKRR